MGEQEGGREVHSVRDALGQNSGLGGHLAVRRGVDRIRASYSDTLGTGLADLLVHDRKVDWPLLPAFYGSDPRVAKSCRRRRQLQRATRQFSLSMLSLILADPSRCEPKGSGQPENDTYRFPIRVGDQTEFLNPMQLPMWMNSPERRLAPHVRALLAQGPCVVRIHRRIGYNQQTNRARICELLSLDENHRHVVVGQRDNQTLTPPFTISGPQATVTANVPLTYISAVWHDPQGVPEIAVNGSLFADFDPLRPFNTPPFIPYLGGA